jgi:hypothetical protein
VKTVVWGGATVTGLEPQIFWNKFFSQPQQPPLDVLSDAPADPSEDGAAATPLQQGLDGCAAELGLETEERLGSNVTDISPPFKSDK